MSLCMYDPNGMIDLDSREKKGHRRLLVCDLDNTLYDWVTYYARSFRAMLSVIEQESGISQEVLIREFRDIHHRYHTSEYAFSIQKLPSILAQHPGCCEQDIVIRYGKAIEAFRGTRREVLQLYPSVMETLRKLQSTDVRIVGLSDAVVYYAVGRLRMLGILDFFDAIYVVRDHDLPTYIDENRDLTLFDTGSHTRIVEFPPRHVKPNPKLLSAILHSYGVGPEEAVMVGDSLGRDISMAETLGICSAWARYGHSFRHDDFELLVSITHWSPADVERERSAPRSITPTFTLQKFSDLLPLFSRDHDG